MERSLSDCEKRSADATKRRSLPKPSVPPKPSVAPKPKTLPKKMPPPRPTSSPMQSKSLPSFRPKTGSVGNKVPPPRPMKVPLAKLSNQKDYQGLRNSETRAIENDTETKEDIPSKTAKKESAVGIDGIVSENKPKEKALCSKELGSKHMESNILRDSLTDQSEISIIESNKNLPLKAFPIRDANCRDETNDDSITVQGALEGDKSLVKQEKVRVELNADIVEEALQNAPLASGKVEQNLDDTKVFEGACRNEKKQTELKAEIIEHEPQPTLFASGKVEHNFDDIEYDKDEIKNERLSFKHEKEQIESNAEIIDDKPQYSTLASGKGHNLVDTKDFQLSMENERISVEQEKKRVEENSEEDKSQNGSLAANNEERKAGDFDDEGAVEEEKFSFKQSERVESNAEIIKAEPQNASLDDLMDDVCESKGVETKDKGDVDKSTILQNFNNNVNPVFEHEHEVEENNIEITEDLSTNTNVVKMSFPDNSEETVVDAQDASEVVDSVLFTDNCNEGEIEPKPVIYDCEKVNHIDLQGVKKVEKTENESYEVSGSLVSENKETSSGDEKSESERTKDADLLTELNCRESAFIALKNVETEEDKSVENSILDFEKEKLNVKAQLEIEQTCNEFTDTSDIVKRDTLEQLENTSELNVAVSVEQRESGSGDEHAAGVDTDETKHAVLGESMVLEQEQLSEDQVVSNTNIKTDSKIESDVQLTTEELEFGKIPEDTSDRPAIEERKESACSEKEEFIHEDLVGSFEESEGKAIKQREPAKIKEDLSNFVDKSFDLARETKTFNIESSENGKNLNLGLEGPDSLHKETITIKSKSTNKEKTISNTLVEKDKVDMKSLVEEKSNSSHELVKKKEERKLVVERSDGEKAVESSILVETVENMTNLSVKSGDSPLEERSIKTDYIVESDSSLAEEEIVPVSESDKFTEGSEKPEKKPSSINQEGNDVQEESVMGNLEATVQETIVNMDKSEPVRPVRSKRTKKQRDESEVYEEVGLTEEASIKPRNQRQCNSDYENIVLKPDRNTINGESVKIPEIDSSRHTDTNIETIYYNNVPISSSVPASDMVKHVESSESYYNVPVNSSKIADHDLSAVSVATVDSDAEYAVPKPHLISVQSDYVVPVAASEIPREDSAIAVQSDLEDYSVPKPHPISFQSGYSVPVAASEIPREDSTTAVQSDLEEYSVPRPLLVSVQSDYSVPVAASEIPREDSTTAVQSDLEEYSVPRPLPLSVQSDYSAAVQSDLEEYSVPKPHSGVFLSDYSVPSNSVEATSQAFGLSGQDVDKELYSVPQTSVAETHMPTDVFYSVPSSHQNVETELDATRSENAARNSASQSIENNTHLSDDNLYSVPLHNSLQVGNQIESEDYVMPKSTHASAFQTKDFIADHNVYSVPQQAQAINIAKPPPKPVPTPRLSSSPKSASESPEPKPRKLLPGARPVFPVAAPRLVSSIMTNKEEEKSPEIKHDLSLAPSPRPRSKVICVEEHVYSPSRKGSSGQLPSPEVKTERPTNTETQRSMNEVFVSEETSDHERPRSSIFYTKGPKRRAPPPPRPPPPEKRLSMVDNSDSCSAIRTSLGLHGESSDSESSDVEVSGEHSQEKQGPSKSKTQYIADEILSTEKTFVHALQLVYEECYSKIQKENVVAVSTLNDIFKDLGNIYFLDCKFLQELEGRMKTWDEHERIGDIVRKYSHFLKIYTTYINGYDKAMNTFMEIMKENLQFASLVNEFHASEQCHGMQIQSFMLKPVQRIPSYRLLLMDYLKHLPQDSEEYTDTKVALDIVSEVATHINESMKKVDSTDKLLRIQNSLVGHHEIMKPGRYYIKEGPLMKLCRKDMQERHFFLLTDVLLYCTPVGSTQYKLNTELPLLGMKVNLPDSSDFVNEFIITSTTRSFILLASTPEERDEWIEVLNKAIEDQTKKKITFINKTAGHVDALPEESLYLGQRAPVWIPDARVTMCMLCTVQFTVTTRRHHCRACGKVVCSSCSDNEAPLVYLDYNPSRVCDVCYGTLLKDFHKDTKPPDEESPINPVMIQTNSLERERQEKKPSRIEMIARFRSTRKRKSSTPKTLRPSVLLEVGGDEGGSQMSGYLKFKKGGRHFKKQWFVLKDNVLYAYKASSDVVALETIPVLSYEVGELRKDGNEIVFQLKHKGIENLTFRAENQNSATRWVDELKKATRLEGA